MHLSMRSAFVANRFRLPTSTKDRRPAGMRDVHFSRPRAARPQTLLTKEWVFGDIEYPDAIYIVNMDGIGNLIMTDNEVEALALFVGLTLEHRGNRRKAYMMKKDMITGNPVQIIHTFTPADRIR